jgi:hypothetical protein
MSEFISWTPGDWYALGTFLVQLAFLAAGVWFARNLLRVLRAFQEQLEALLKLSSTSAPAERLASSVSVKHSQAFGSPYWLALPDRQLSDTQPASVPDPTNSGPSRFVAAWHRVVVWLEAPMSSAELTPWHRVISWLQAPIAS